ncbi:MAG: bi-domain-containing oxidoreductase [Ignavibacteriae bacterium]|nr:bi-domain-containing oxidoreductase [Ignavibacteriota bacterium]
MKQVTQQNKTGEIRVENVPVPAVKEGHVLVRVRRSVISAGTERASVESRKMSLWQRAKRQPELVAKVFEQVRQYGVLQTYRRVQARLEATTSLGYSVAGDVVAVGEGVSECKAGDRVACAGAGYANHAEFVSVPKNLCVVIPRGVEYESAAYATLGAIALQGIRQANPAIGETVAVIGLGLIGQLAVQMLKANGCAVIGIDLDPWNVKIAKDSGADLALVRGVADVKNIVNSFTKGVGVDAVVITAATKSNDPVQLAGGLCREKGRVVLVGDVGLQLPRAPYYMKELDFRLSRSYGPGRYDAAYEERGQDYPVGYVRWTENRNMQEFLRLVAQKKIDLAKITTHRFDIEQAKSAYALISNPRAYKHEKYLGIILHYGDTDGKGRADTVITVTERSGKPSTAALSVGFLGAGSFAQGMLLPHVRRFKDISMTSVCTANGLNAANVARSFGFQFATTDAKEILTRENIGTVFITARHNLHAPFVLDALKAGKNVFVEKPLCLTIGELKDIQAAYAKLHSSKSALRTPYSTLLMVGFNRRFSPHAEQVKKFFEDAVGPYAIQYRVSAGFVPASHWTREPVEGGGRIVGEVCHFVDFMQFVTGSKPVRVYAEPLGKRAAGAADDDSVAITISFEDGSIGVISYLANGDASVPKEFIEITSTNRTAVLENFQKLALYQNGKKLEFKHSTIEKGHKEEIRQFLFAVRDGKPSPIPFESAVITTLTTFRIVESLKSGRPIAV